MSTQREDLEGLKAALTAATPAPDAARRAEILARAMESFETHHDLAPEPRPVDNRPKRAGLFAGVSSMFDRLTSRAVLGATASIAVLGIGIALIPPGGLPLVPGPAAPKLAVEEAPGHVVPQGYGQGQAGVAVQAEATAEIQPVAPTALPPGPPPAITPLPSDQASGAAGMPRAAMRDSLARQARPAASPAPMSPDRMAQAPAAGADSFAKFDASEVQVTTEAPVSTFSIDVDTASWAWARRALQAGLMPDPASVRVEEMINYFPYDYAAPQTGSEQPFAVSVARFASPWAEGRDLVRIGLQGQLPEVAARPPLDLVFLIDTSGSMEGEDRLGLLKTSLALLLGELRAEDKVAIVAYAGSAGEVLAPTSASEKSVILGALDALQAGGSTAGGEGLALAYATAAKMGGEGRTGRVILATDGDFNVGISEVEALKAYVAQKRKSGVALSVLGFGRGNLDDALMQTLAQNGNGQAAYIDSAEEARKVMVDQASGMLFPIAADVKIQVEWNPAEVAEYRLIGYETRALSRTDFADDKVDAGEIGAGHQVTALYEITPVGSPARLSEPLRYGGTPVAGTEGEAGWLRLRYKNSGEAESRLIEAPITAALAEPDADARFATAIAGFGQLLAGGRFTGDWGYGDAVALAEGARGEDRFGYRAGAVSLMRLAEALAQK